MLARFGNRELAIQTCVTNRYPTEKLAQLEARELATFEIDLSAFGNGEINDSFARQLLEGAHVLAVRRRRSSTPPWGRSQNHLGLSCPSAGSGHGHSCRCLVCGRPAHVSNTRSDLHVVLWGTTWTSFLAVAFLRMAIRNELLR